jgi:hypothetical protein
MKKFSVTCLAIILFGAITCNPVWARGGGGGHGGGFGDGHFGGGSHFGGGGGHYGGGWGHGGGYGYGRGIYGLGLGLGLGYGLGYYGGYPYYGGYGYGGYGYPSTVVTVPATPPVYIQQTPPVAQQYQSGYWYYCSNPEGYYPYIKQCLNGWQQVAPTPPTHP